MATGRQFDSWQSSLASQCARHRLVRLAEAKARTRPSREERERGRAEWEGKGVVQGGAAAGPAAMASAELV